MGAGIALLEHVMLVTVYKKGHNVKSKDSIDVAYRRLYLGNILKENRSNFMNDPLRIRPRAGRRQLILLKAKRRRTVSAPMGR